MVQGEGSSPHFSTLLPSVRILRSPGPLTRPPTPPRASRPSDVANVPGSAGEASLKDEQDLLATPSSAESTENRRKKVAFNVDGTRYHKQEDFGSSPLRILPKLGSTPAKSILKPFKCSPFSSMSSSFTDLGIAPHTHASFASMLESVTQALASTDRSRKLDTYITFCNTLNAYDVIPDMKAMRNKMSLLTSSIRRDLGAKTAGTEKYDNQLVAQAIKLLAVLSWMPELVESIEDQDAVAFINHAIQVLQEHESPKILVNHFLYFLAHQKFPARVMTLERANTILIAVDDIDDRISGNSVLLERTNIYIKLIQQNKQAMTGRAADWIRNVLSTAISNNKEMRQGSLKCFMEAVRTLGSEKGIYRGITNAFNNARGEGETVITKVTEHLTHLAKNGEGVYVAQLWGAIVLLLRGRPHPMSQWEHFKRWLTVIEPCFNSSTIQTKIAANSAWSKLIYVMHCPPDFQAKELELLLRPIARYLDPQNASSNSRGARNAALSNICTLLYFSMRPSGIVKQISFAWDNIVVRLIEKLVLYNRDEVDQACKILEGMLDGSSQKLWNETRCLEKDVINPGEIPRLDPKWVRSNCATVLKTLDVAIRRASWKGASMDSDICLLWRKFTKTLADASSKEVKVSAELMEAVAHLFNMLQRLWRDGPDAFMNTSDKSSQGFLEKLGFLVITALEYIGAFCFTEKHLAFDDEHKFVAVSTPSNRFPGSSPSVTFHPPIVHLFQLFLHPFKGASIAQHYFSILERILSSCVNSLDSRRKRIALLSACRSILPTRDPSTVHKEAWEVLARLVEASLLTPARDKSLLSTPLPQSWEFRDAVNILQWGCKHSNKAWISLFEASVHAMKAEQGEAQVMTAIIEPLSDALRLERPDTEIQVWLGHGKAVVDKASFAKTRNLENSRSPFGAMPRKAITAEHFEPLESLYNMVNQFLIAAYPSQEEIKTPLEAADFIGSVADLVDRCPQESAEGLLKRIQEGVACWTVDSRKLLDWRRTPISENQALLSTLRMLRELWDSIASAIARLPKHDSTTLHSLSILVTSGLESRIKDVVLRLIKTWNSTFGSQQFLRYPNTVRLALKRLRPIADVLLPTFPEDIDEIVGTPPVFVDSQDSQHIFNTEKELWSSPTPMPSSLQENRQSRTPLSESFPPSSNFTSRLKEVPLPKSRASPRPNHHDSQIVFAPIASDDADMAVDSQLLTEHQREVRERQHLDAALFPEMHGTSVPLTHKVRKRPEPAKSEDTEECETEEVNSGDEFVDAPEEIAQALDTPVRSIDYREVDVVPSTIFAVEIPIRAPQHSLLPKPQRERVFDESEGEVPGIPHEIPTSVVVPASFDEGFDSEEEDIQSSFQEDGEDCRALDGAPLGRSGFLLSVADSFDKVSETPQNVSVHETVSVVGIKPLDAAVHNTIQVPTEQDLRKHVLEIPDSFQVDGEIHEPLADHLEMSFHVDTNKYEYALIDADERQLQDDNVNNKANLVDPTVREEGDGQEREQVQSESTSSKSKRRSRGRPRGSVSFKSRRRKSTSQPAGLAPEPVLESIVVASPTENTPASRLPSPGKHKHEQIDVPVDQPEHGNKVKARVVPSTPNSSSKKRKMRSEAVREPEATEARTSSSPRSIYLQTPTIKKRRMGGHAGRIPTPVAQPDTVAAGHNFPHLLDESTSARNHQGGFKHIVLDSPLQQFLAQERPQDMALEPQRQVNIMQGEKPESPQSTATGRIVQRPNLASPDSQKPELYRKLPVSELDPLERLKAALATIEHGELDPEKERTAEDLIFDTYYRLREKRRNRDAAGLRGLR